jgi:hypothetical protein
MNLPSLNHLSQQELVDALNDLRKKESVALADIVLHLSEVDSRKIYRDLGYPSLYAYCTIALGYSESAAYRRITAARCLTKHPEVYEKIRDGRMNLCAVAELSKVVTTENKVALFEAAEGKSRREVEELTAPRRAPDKTSLVARESSYGEMRGIRRSERADSLAGYRALVTRITKQLPGDWLPQQRIVLFGAL